MPTSQQEKTEVKINDVTITKQLLGVIELRLDGRRGHHIPEEVLRRVICERLAENFGAYVGDAIVHNKTKIRTVLGRGRKFREFEAFLARNSLTLKSKVEGWKRPPTSGGSQW